MMNRRRRSNLRRWSRFRSVQTSSATVISAFTLVWLYCRYTARKQVIVAYFIQASVKNSKQVPRLVGALCDRNAVFSLHLDVSIPSIIADDVTRSARKRCSSRLILVPREHVTYRGITLSHNYLSGAVALFTARVNFDYFINISGADYPTVRTCFLTELLATASSYRLSFIDWHPQEKWRRFARGRLMRRFVDTALVAPNLPGRYYTPPNDIPLPETAPQYLNLQFEHIGWTVAKSSGWFIWHRSLVEHLLLDNRARNMLAAFAQSDASDEHYFATVVWNSPDLRSRTVPSNWRAVFFEAPNGSAPLLEDGITRSRQHPFYVDEEDENGHLLFWSLLQQTPAFFTRKVRDNGRITDEIDSHLLNGGPLRRRYESLVRSSFKTSVQHHLDSTKLDIDESSPFQSVFDHS